MEKTIIFSTHRINEVKSCDDIGIMNKGELKYVGTYKNFLNNMKEKIFEMNLLE